MGTTLATKQDFVLQRQEWRQELQLLRQAFESRFTLLDQKIDAMRSDFSRDLAALELKMTVKLGSMIFVGFGLTIAALRLWT